MPGQKDFSRGRIGKPHENQLLLDTAMQEAGIDSTYELAERAGVAPSVLYKFRKGVTTRFYGTTERRLAMVLPNLFGKRVYSPSEMRVKSAPLRERFEKSIAKAATKTSQSAASKKSAPAKAAKKKSKISPVTTKASTRKASPGVASRAKKATKSAKTAKTAKTAKKKAKR